MSMYFHLSPTYLGHKLLATELVSAQTGHSQGNRFWAGEHDVHVIPATLAKVAYGIVTHYYKKDLYERSTFFYRHGSKR